jgi:hypothetical protein
MSYEIKYTPFEFSAGSIQQPATFADLVHQEPYPTVPDVHHHCGFAPAAASSVHMCEEELLNVFFSPQNTELIQQTIRYRFYELSGYSIDRQKEEDLIMIMRSVFVTNSRNIPGQVTDQVTALNQKVVDLCLPMIARGVEQFLGYVKDASSLPDPIPRGEATSIKGLLPSEIRYGF